MLNLLKYEITSRWVAVLGWGIGMALFGSMYIGIWPEMSAQIGDLADLSIYETFAIDMGTFGGYIASVVVQYIPLLVGVYAIVASTGTLAGEEDRGTLELLLATPLPRWQIVTVKAIAISVVALLIVIIAGIGDALTLSAVRSSVETDVTPLQFFGVVLNSWPITFAFMMMGLFFGAYLPNRRVAVSVLATIFIASYFVKILASLVDSMEFIKYVSLFNYFDTSADVFDVGVQASDVLILLMVGLACFGLAVVSFQRRNVTVNAWPWQRPTVTA